MTTRKFTQTFKRGPEPLSGEIALESPDEIGEEIEQRGFQRYLLPAMGAVMALMIGITIYMGVRQFSIQSLMFPAMFVMMGLGVMASRAGANSKSIPEIDTDRKVYLRYLSGVRTRAATSAARQVAFWAHHAPHPADLSGIVGKPRQWSRQPAGNTTVRDGDVAGDAARRKGDIRADLYLVTRVGTGTAEADDKLLRPSSMNGELVGPDTAPAPYLEPVQHMWMVKFLRTHSLIQDCPKATSLRTHPTVSIGGNPDRAADLLRSMICQLALFHAPDTLQIRVRTNNPDAPEWSWLKWLPHIQHPAATGPNGPLRLFYPADTNDQCVSDLLSRKPHQPDNLPAGPYHIIINLDSNTTYPSDGRVGVTYITLGHVRAQYQMKVAADGTLFHSSRTTSQGWQLLGTADTMSPLRCF